MQNTFSQSGNDSKWFLTKIIFQNRYVALETPPLHGKCHLKFPFLFSAHLLNNDNNNVEYDFLQEWGCGACHWKAGGWDQPGRNPGKVDFHNFIADYWTF